MSLTLKILIAMITGVLLGGLIHAVSPSLPESVSSFIDMYITGGLFYIISKVFVASLKLLVVPLVLVSLVCGTANLGSGSGLGRIGLKSLSLYLLTTAIAITVAMVLAMILQPGVGADLATTKAFTVNESKPFSEVLINMFPSNPFQSMVQGHMLQVIVFAILLGIAMTHAGDAGKDMLKRFEDWNEIIMKLVMILMNLAPYGVFSLLIVLFAKEGLGTIAELALYFFTVVAVLLIHAFVVYPSLLTILGRLNPVTFFKKMYPVQMFAFSTSSSNATLPVTMETAKYKLGVNNKVGSFTIPLGATINMDGTAIMQGVATVFIAQAYGIDIGVSAILTVILMATLASIGTAGVPGVGLITLSMVLTQVNLPVEGIALIIGVDRLLDMIRTAVNVTGDATVSCIVAKSEGMLDEETYNAHNEDLESQMS